MMPTSPVELSQRSLDLRLMTPGQRWKLRRDLVIYLANGQGASQRMLADVFDLPHSRISAILKNMKLKYGHSDS
jgi:hypothetical protein